MLKIKDIAIAALTSIRLLPAQWMMYIKPSAVETSTASLFSSSLLFLWGPPHHHHILCLLSVYMLHMSHNAVLLLSHYTAVIKDVHIDTYTNKYIQDPDKLRERASPQEAWR